MRIYKSVRKNSRNELKNEIGQLKQDGWHPGPARINTDSLYPHQCRLWKDLKKDNQKVVSQ